MHDGHFDENTKALGADADGGYWGNYVEINHGGGWVTRYLHMRKDTITVKVERSVDYRAARRLLTHADPEVRNLVAECARVEDQARKVTLTRR